MPLSVSAADAAGSADFGFRCIDVLRDPRDVVLIRLPRID
jgi:hypothetical protein